MSAPVSYASAARSATSNDEKDSQLKEQPVTSTVSAEEVTNTESNTIEADENTGDAQPESKEASITKEKVSLTPAPVPKVNPWKVASASASESSSKQGSPSASDAVLASTDSVKAALDPVHWPTPDEGDKKEATGSTSNGTVRARPGKEKWIPLNYTPVTSKPRGNKPRSGNSGKTSHSHSGSASGSNNSSAAAKSRGSKNFSKTGGSQKKTDKIPVKTQAPKPVSGPAPVNGSAATIATEETVAKENAKPKANSPVPSAAGPKANNIKKGRFNGEESASTNGFHHHSHHHNHHNHHHHHSRGGNFNNQQYSYNGRKNYNKFYVNDYNMYGVQSQLDSIIPAIIYQLDYYFSFENLKKDLFLRKQMNSNGWVPLSILSSFNRVKALTGGDYKLFLEACKWLQAVEVVGDKARARNNWEQWVFPLADRLPAGKDETNPSITPKLVFNPAKAAPFVPKSDSVVSQTPVAQASN